MSDEERPDIEEPVEPEVDPVEPAEPAEPVVADPEPAEPAEPEGDPEDPEEPAEEVKVKAIPKSLKRKGKKDDAEIHRLRVEALKANVEDVMLKLGREYNEVGYPAITIDELLDESDAPKSINWRFCANRALLLSQLTQ